jgi:transcription-repair coupling factor (superfamily II helicase)
MFCWRRRLWNRGLDIPTANTMIVHRADMFGLAQFYQIRGSVGRSKTRAYAYLTTKPRHQDDRAGREAAAGVGVSLDSRWGRALRSRAQDLDIRGAGNLLGEEQSGQMQRGGVRACISRCLRIEIAADQVQARHPEGIVDDGQWAPQINLGVPVLIPEELCARPRCAPGALSPPVQPDHEGGA